MLAFASPSGRLPPITGSATPDSDLIGPPVAVESLWADVRDSVPLTCADCTPSPVELRSCLRDDGSLSEAFILRTFCLVALNASVSSPLGSPLDLRRRAVPVPSLSFHADCASTLKAWSSPGSVWLHSSGVISMRCSFAPSEPTPLLSLSLPCQR